MKLKLSEIKDIYLSLASLDGYNKLTLVNGKEAVTRVPYDFPYQTRWNIAKNLKTLKKTVDLINEENDRLVKEISGGGQRIKEEDVAGIELHAQKMDDFLQAEDDIALLRFKAKDLLGVNETEEEACKNPIPGTILLTLFSLIDE